MRHSDIRTHRNSTRSLERFGSDPCMSCTSRMENCPGSNSMSTMSLSLTWTGIPCPADSMCGNALSSLGMRPDSSSSDSTLLRQVRTSSCVSAVKGKTTPCCRKRSTSDSLRSLPIECSLRGEGLELQTHLVGEANVYLSACLEY